MFSPVMNQESMKSMKTIKNDSISSCAFAEYLK